MISCDPVTRKSWIGVNTTVSFHNILAIVWERQRRSATTKSKKKNEEVKNDTTCTQYIIISSCFPFTVCVSYL
jgi:hypothetical protein